VDDAERMVAVGDAVDEDANGEQVVDLLVRLLALFHLLVNRPQMLRPAGDVDVANRGLGESRDQRLGHLLDQRFALAPFLRHFLGKGFVLFCFEMFE
jgi:hypothetical protein